MSWNRRIFLLLTTLLGVFFILIVYLRLPEPLALDQGLFACFGRWIPRGWMPYLDIWDSKPPMIFYTYTLAFAVFGESATAVWLFEGLWMAVTAIFVFLLAKNFWGRWEGLTASFFVLLFIYSPSWGGFWSKGQAEVFIALPLVVSAYCALRAKNNPIYPFLTGICVGIVTLYKVPALLPAAGFPVLYWMIKRSDYRLIVWLVFGICFPWLLVLGYFFAHGAAGDFIEAVFVYSREYAGVIGVRYWTELLSKGLKRWFLGAPLIVFWGVVGIALLKKRISWCLGSWLLLSLASVFIQRQLAGYHFVLIAVPLAVVAGCGLVKAIRAFSPPAVKIFPLLGILISIAMLWFELARWRMAYRPNWDYQRGVVSRSVYLKYYNRGAIFSSLEQSVIAHYVKRNTLEDESILVWGIAPNIYFLADRKPATRYLFHHILLTYSPLSFRFSGLQERRRNFLHRIMNDPPIYILVGVRDANRFEPLDSYTQLTRFKKFAAFVSQNYKRENQIGHFLILRKKI